MVSRPRGWHCPPKRADGKARRLQPTEMELKNPWMSMWLSEWHKAANTGKGLMMAEMTRQQNAMMKAWSEQMTEAWMAVWMPWAAGGRKRR